VKKRAALAALAALAAGAGLTACSSPTSARPQAASPAVAAPTTAAPKAGAGTTQELAWWHIGKFFDDTQIWYVERVTNKASTPASVALNVNAKDADGVIVGSGNPTLPNIPPHDTFDFFGYVGGGGALDTKLTGTPTKLDVSNSSNAFGNAGAVEEPLFQTTSVQLVRGTEDTYTDAKYSYNMQDTVTATQQCDGGVTQQVVLYDASGNVVGGDTGTSDNAPDHLTVGMKYREQWTGIPAIAPAASIKHSVWCGE
jgi:hypothetical protein